jgi:hypothetical protein
MSGLQDALVRSYDGVKEELLHNIYALEADKEGELDELAALRRDVQDGRLSRETMELLERWVRG